MLTRKIILYSPTAQPYGALSNNAFVPMSVDGVTWRTVSEYVYVNALPKRNDTYANVMKSKSMNGVFFDPYGTMFQTISEVENTLFGNALIEGTSVKLNDANSDTRRRFDRLNAIGIKVPYERTDAVRRFEHFLKNALMDRDKHTFIDKKYGLLDRKGVERYLANLYDHMSKNDNLPSDTSYTVLEKIYGQSVVDANGEGIRKVDIIMRRIGNDLDRAVIVTKRLLHDDRAIVLDRFKMALVDAYLDVILESRYPNVPFDMFEEAKAQQRASYHEYSYFIESAKNAAYDRYVAGQLDETVLAKVKMVAPETIEEEDLRLEQDFDRYAIKPVPSVVLELSDDDALLPEYVEKFTVNGQTFTSVLQYAYVSIARNLLDASVTLPDDVRYVKEAYVSARNKILTERLIDLMKRGISAKLNQHSSLTHALLLSGNSLIRWGDEHDAVLGSIPRGMRTNAVGKFLMQQRSVIDPKSPSMNKRMSDYDDPFVQNALLASWFAYRIADYMNGVNLIREPTLKKLELIYGIRANTIGRRTPTEACKQRMRSCMASVAHQDMLWALILGEYVVFETESERDTVSRFLQTFDNEHPSVERFNRAFAYFRNNVLNVRDETGAFLVEPVAGVDADTFVRFVLAGNVVGGDIAPWRINRWASFE